MLLAVSSRVCHCVTMCSECTKLRYTGPYWMVRFLFLSCPHNTLPHINISRLFCFIMHSREEDQIIYSERMEENIDLSIKTPCIPCRALMKVYCNVKSIECWVIDQSHWRWQWNMTLNEAVFLVIFTSGWFCSGLHRSDRSAEGKAHWLC